MIQIIFANLLTILIVAVISWLAHWNTRRSRLLGFFGLKEQRRLVLYVSNVRVQSGGSVGVDDQPRSFAGTTIPWNEALLIPVFQRLFNWVLPGLTEQPDYLRRLLLSDIEVDALPSPLNVADVERASTFVAIGSPAFNGASLWIEQAFDPPARFSDEGFKLKDVPDITDLRCGFIQRVFNPRSRQTAFYVAGHSVLATTGAMYVLITHWSDLAKKYGSSRPFCIVCRFGSDDPCSHEVLFEKG